MQHGIKRDQYGAGGSVRGVFLYESAVCGTQRFTVSPN